MIPTYLSIAGSDCSAGAGLQADLKAGFALGCYPQTAVTCVVSEVPGKVESIVAMEPEFVASQVRICLQHFPIAAIKTGMLYSPEIVQAVVAELHDYTGPLVVDPVMIATAGEPLILQTAISVYEQALMPKTTLLTPNLDELQRLLGTTSSITTPQELKEAATTLAARYNCAILAKGGHLSGGNCTDMLVHPDGSGYAWEHARMHRHAGASRWLRIRMGTRSHGGHLHPRHRLHPFQRRCCILGTWSRAYPSGGARSALHHRRHCRLL